MDKIYSPIKERILQFIENQKIVKEKFYLKTDISSSNFKSIGAKSELGGDKIAKILSNYPNLDAMWLLTGQGEMLRILSNSENISTIDKDKIDHNCKACQEKDKLIQALEKTISAQEKALNNQEDLLNFYREREESKSSKTVRKSG